ncbi:hypothetical protein EV562_113128 [Streptomyces sp. BK208]|uniref:hypothetical protein n=1 Tax=Streptomyces sp. BK208 TaxID=2512150 RepID=UPI00105CE5ED|nr:hypothetical protein [Streptomyces sp. BK208]TDT29263.1 hypothetical protein EV562_113128 [Streptomyces sp. BK208]
MTDTQVRPEERKTRETRARGTMAIWQWARWAALFLAVGWALNLVAELVEGAQGRGLWWPLISTVIWAGVTVHGFVTYRRIRTTTLPALTGRRSL